MGRIKMRKIHEKTTTKKKLARHIEQPIESMCNSITFDRTIAVRLAVHRHIRERIHCDETRAQAKIDKVNLKQKTIAFVSEKSQAQGRTSYIKCTAPLK
jgi:hypothetical protein